MSPEPVKPHRLSLSDILTMTLTRHPSRETSDLERGMRGEVKVTVAGVCRDGETAEEMDGRTAERFERLCARFPMASGYVRANGGE